MNKTEVSEYSESVTLEDIKQMFVNAKSKITDWQQVSTCNIGLSKGVAFNILSACLISYKTIDDINKMALKNMLREFGEYLPGYLYPLKKDKVIHPVAHQEPNSLPF